MHVNAFVTAIFTAGKEGYSSNRTGISKEFKELCYMSKAISVKANQVFKLHSLLFAMVNSCYICTWL